MPRRSAAVLAASTGLVEPLLPLGLAFAGGAMLYVVVDDCSCDPGTPSSGQPLSTPSG